MAVGISRNSCNVIQQMTAQAALGGAWLWNARRPSGVTAVVVTTGRDLGQVQSTHRERVADVNTRQIDPVPATAWSARSPSPGGSLFVRGF
jgi:hypothetical protein